MSDKPLHDGANEWLDALQSRTSLRPLYVTEEMVEKIEGWASNATHHGDLSAWGVLSQCMEWRIRE